MKNLLIKLRTLLMVLLIISGAGIFMWIIASMGQLAKKDSGIGGTIAFAILGFGAIILFIYGIIRRGKVIRTEKDMAKIAMEKEKMQNEIKKLHSSN